MEGAAAADRAKYRNSCSAKRVQAGSTSSTSFGMKAEPPARPRRDDVLVDKAVKKRPLTATGDILPAGKAFTATRIIFHQLPLPFCLTEEIILGQLFNTPWTTAVLEDEGLRNKIKANSGVRSWRFYRSSTRLPVSGNVPRVAL